MSEARRVFLGNAKKIQEEHEKVSDGLLEILATIKDKRSGVAADATMHLD